MINSDPTMKPRTPYLRYLDNQIASFEGRSELDRYKKGLITERQSIFLDALKEFVYREAELPHEMVVELYVAFAELLASNKAPDLFVPQEAPGGRQSFIVQDYIKTAVEFIRLAENGRFKSLGCGKQALTKAKQIVAKNYKVDRKTPGYWYAKFDGEVLTEGELEPEKVESNMKIFGKRYQRERMPVRRS